MWGDLTHGSVEDAVDQDDDEGDDDDDDVSVRETSSLAALIRFSNWSMLQSQEYNSDTSQVSHVLLFGMSVLWC